MWKKVNNKSFKAILIALLIQSNYIALGNLSFLSENWQPIVKDSKTDKFIPGAQIWLITDDTINIFVSDEYCKFDIDMPLSDQLRTMIITQSNYSPLILQYATAIKMSEFRLNILLNKNKSKSLGNGSSNITSLIPLLAEYQFLLKFPPLQEALIVKQMSIFTGRSYEKGEPSEYQLPFKLIIRSFDNKGAPGASLIKKVIIVHPLSKTSCLTTIDLSYFDLSLYNTGLFAGIERLPAQYYASSLVSERSYQKEVYIGTSARNSFFNLRNNFESWARFPWFDNWRIFKKGEYNFQIKLEFINESL